MRVAIIGCGKVSSGHIKAWQDRDDAEIVMLVDASRENAEETREAAELSADIPFSEDYLDALRHFSRSFPDDPAGPLCRCR